MRMVDKDGVQITNENTKSQALGKGLNALTMHAFMIHAKLDEKLNKFPQHRLDAQLQRLREAIGDDPNITLYMGFGLWMAMNPKESTGIEEELMDSAFNKYMAIMNQIK